jgi:hypothetical protein
MLLVITFVNGTNPKQAACVFEVVWLSWLSNASLFGLVFLLFGGDIIWPGCLYLTSHLKQNPAVFLDSQKQHTSGVLLLKIQKHSWVLLQMAGEIQTTRLPECVWKRRVVEEMDETHLIVVIGWPALKSVERA